MKLNLKWGLGFLALSLIVVMTIIYKDSKSGSGEGAMPTVKQPIISQSSESLALKDSSRHDSKGGLSDVSESHENSVGIQGAAIVGHDQAEFAQDLLPPVPPQFPVDAFELFAKSDAVVTQENIHIDPPMSEIGRTWTEDDGQRNNFSMPVTGGRNLEIEVARFVAIGQDGGEFFGHVKGAPRSSVELFYRGGSEAGTIRLPSENRIYRILPSEGNGIIIQERNLSMDESSNAGPPLGAEIPSMPNFTPPPPPDWIVESVN
jgi:hypothetical protein